MIEVQLVYEGEGKFGCASKFDFTLAADKLGAGEVLTARLMHKRSGRQHRWFFSMVQAAWDNQRAGPRFDTADRLRHWLLIQAGHCDEKRFEPAAMTKEVAAWLRATRDDIDFATDNRWIYARTAKSISYKACDHDTMCEIADRVVEVIMERIVPGSTHADWEPFYVVDERDQQKRTGRASQNAGPHVPRDRSDRRQQSEQLSSAVS